MRMSERSITEQMLDIVEKFGVDDGDKIILNKKAIDSALTSLKKISQGMQKMSKRGGLVLVKSGDMDVTTYALDSFNRKLSKDLNM
ncbi:hypothetical protein BCS98_10970 [Vibrio breoganii]|nr:hypothetical protein BCU80_07125 [Vibrio breoganii]PMK23234.1 hypothetical protein BCU06_04280 [Vibrio breoganii]PMK55654.1 hypothetical protein BCT98_10290 [Vibrio breoganii]PMK67131.1 hypothetical protein BCT94_17605 [Vibrio breoganii]PML25778.1 hypothetical protein BCT82_11180 [Vibrio breoganii]